MESSGRRTPRVMGPGTRFRNGVTSSYRMSRVKEQPKAHTRSNIVVQVGGAPSSAEPRGTAAPSQVHDCERVAVDYGPSGRPEGEAYPTRLSESLGHSHPEG